MRAIGATSLLALGLAVLSPRGVAAADASGARDAPSCCGIEGGVDVVSATVWRGRDFSDSPGAEPWIEVTLGGAYAAASGSWAFDASWSEQEVDAGYRLPLLGGTLSLGASAYFYGDTTSVRITRRSTLAQVSGATVVEAAAQYEGPRAVPIRLLVAGNVSGDTSRAAYGEVALEPTWRSIDIGVFAGAALTRSAYYAADAGDVVDVGVSLDRELRISRLAAVGIGAAAIYNPTRAKWWGVAHAGISFAFGSERREAPTGPVILGMDRRQ